LLAARRQLRGNNPRIDAGCIERYLSGGQSSLHCVPAVLDHAFTTTAVRSGGFVALLPVRVGVVWHF